MNVISKLLPVFRSHTRNILPVFLSDTNSVPPVVTLSSNIIYVRYFSNERGRSGLTKTQEKAEISTDVRPLVKKVKEDIGSFSYKGVILLGVGAIFFCVFKMFFSSNSANNIYSKALKKCKNDPRVEDALGAPTNGYGKEVTRPRNHMQMRFYIKGVRNNGVVMLDMEQNNDGNYDCRYLLVQLDDYSGRTFIIEDNRAQLDDKSHMSSLSTNKNGPIKIFLSKIGRRH